MRRAISATIALIFVASAARPQTTGDPHIKWSVVSSENFDVYYYDKGEKKSKDVVQFLENEFERVTGLIGYPPYFKTKVYLYNTSQDLQQRSVSSDKEFLATQGDKKSQKIYIEVADNGNDNAFNAELKLKFSGLLLNQMMFGGGLKDIMEPADIEKVPAWFVNGAILYVARGNTMEMHNYTRNMVMENKEIDFSKLPENEAAIAGQSVWNFIVEKYGKEGIGNLLNYTRITRNEQKSVSITFGVSFKQFMNEWHTYYAQ